MPFAYHPVMLPYIIILVLTAIVNLGFAKWASSRYDDASGRLLVGLAVLTILWACASVGQILTVNRSAAVFFYSIEEFCAASAGVGWFVFGSLYAERDYHSRRWVQVFVVVAAVTPLLLGLTNSFHQLLWSEVVTVTEPVIHYTLQKGIAHYLVMTATYFAMFAGVYMILARLTQMRQSPFSFVLLPLGLVVLLGQNAAVNIISESLTYGYVATITPLGLTIFHLAAVAALKYEIYDVSRYAYSELIETVEASTVAVSPSERVITCNKKFIDEHVEADDKESVRERKLDEVIPDIADELLPLEEGEQVVVTSDGVEETHYHVTVAEASTVVDAIQYTLSITDITDAVASRNTVDRYDEQMQDIARSVGHEFRNPLSVIIGQSSTISHMAERGEIDAERVASQAEAIKRQGNRMNEIVDDFVLLTENIRPPSEYSWVQLGSVVESTAEQVMEEYEPFDYTIHTDGQIYAGRERLAAVLRAVLREAATFHEAADEPVRIGLTGDGLQFEVLMDEEITAETPIAHGQTACQRGHGLGLSVAQSIASVHGWEVSLEQADKNGDGLIPTHLHIEQAQTRSATDISGGE